MLTNRIVRGDILPDGTMHSGDPLTVDVPIDVNPSPETCRECGEHVGHLVSGCMCANCANAAFRSVPDNPTGSAGVLARLHP